MEWEKSQNNNSQRGKRMNYEDMTTEELIAECKRRGIL